MARGAPPWTEVKLRVSHGEVPEFGTVLMIRSNRTGQLTGRVYQVIGVKGRALRCLVIPPEGLAQIEPGTPIWDWWWTPRKPRRR